jgi:hypothetical protein
MADINRKICACQNKSDIKTVKVSQHQRIRASTRYHGYSLPSAFCQFAQIFEKSREGFGDAFRAIDNACAFGTKSSYG